MQTVASLIRELQSFPPDARCYAYEGEGVTRADGSRCHSYLVVLAKGEEYYCLGVVPCAEGYQEDGPAVLRPLGT